MNKKGQTTVEFLLVFAMVAFLVFAFVKLFDEKMEEPFNNFSEAIQKIVATGQSDAKPRAAKIRYK